jgi:peptide/nickel transport system permease protein
MRIVSAIGSIMIVFLLQRILQSIAVLLAVSAVAFSLFRFAGDPVNMMVAEDDNMARREEVREQLGLNKPLPLQFGIFVANAARGEFGRSYRRQQPVAELLKTRLPVTMELVGAACLFAFGIGIPAGVLSALYRGRWVAGFIQTASLIGISMPSFLVGILLIYIFSVELKWLPAFGRAGPSSLILPAVTLGLFQLTLIMRLVRSEMIEVLRTDYIKFARARGLRSRTIYYVYALRGTLVLVITVAGLQIGTMLAFSVVTETVFQWPGLGLLFVQALNDVDIPIMSAYLMLSGLMFVVINFAVDLTYQIVDPRLREGESLASREGV